MKVAAYLRVSTDRQAEHGRGLEVQEQAIKAWAKAQCHKVVRWDSDEGVSGSHGIDQRDGLLDALGALQAGEVGGIVVYRLDRLARDLIVQESLLSEIWRAGGTAFSTAAAEDAYLAPDTNGDDPSRALIRQILGAVSQYERGMVRLRMRSGKQRKAEQGGYIGGAPPLGFRASRGALVPEADEQAVALRILTLRSEGSSLRQICETLSDEGLPPKRGGRWHPQTVSSVLRRAQAS
jgi:DNA invertase Pin-like site-specific DNA recombinase